jgi:putative colanic acid biosynthesis glycosyltransferase
MKLVQINSVVNTGSTGRIVEGIGREALRQGFRSIVAYGRKARESASELVRIGNSLDLYCHAFWSLIDRHGLASSSPTKALLNKLDQLEPDIVHLHNLHGYYLNYQLLFDYLHRSKVPVVWTLHDTWAFTGHCANFDRFNCTKWRNVCYSCPMTSYYPRAMVDNSSANFSAKKHSFTKLENLTIVTPSTWLMRNVEQSFLGKVYCRTINNGIDLNEFRPLNPKSNPPIILGVASTWSERKGLQDFIKLGDLLPPDFKIILVGVTKSQSKQLPRNITAIHRTESTKELARLYSSASVFVNPTYSDNFPTVNIESLACGTPVVTYDTGGSPEAICNSTGSVVPAGDINALAEVVRFWAGKMAGELTKACRDRAVARYSDSDRFSEYVEIYQTLINN